MPYFKSKSGNEELNIFYEDLGNGDPIVFIHGWPVTHAMWEYQITPLREAGYRCISYDRRGFGQSDQSLNNYSYDYLAEDLKNLLDELNLQNVTLVGFSMAGGELVRYCSKYNCERLSRIVLVSSIVPYMMKTDDNPDGVPVEMFNEFEVKLREDRHAFLETFFKQFFGVGFLTHPVSQATLDYSFSLAANASAKATIECLHSFAQTDFRNELSSVTVPTLVIHGDADKTVPIKATGEKAAGGIANSVYKVYEGQPHGLFITQKERLTNDILSFIQTGDVNVADDEIIGTDVDILPSNEPLVTR